MNPQVHWVDMKNTVFMTSAQTSYQEAYVCLVTTGINNLNVSVVSKGHFANAGKEKQLAN